MYLQKNKENYPGYVETGNHEKFECNTCDYQCQKRKRMKAHMLVHKGPSETTMYPCSVCSFRTKYKHYLGQHMKTIHGPDADAPKKYPCTKCSFRNNSRHRLRVHQLTHLDIADKFKCEHCDFESKIKYFVDRHLCSNKPVERPLYRCSLCSYTSKLKTGVYNHMTVHKKPSETNMYECELCPYKSKWPHCLRNHLKTHKTEEVPVHKCEHCDFQANNKYSVRTHAQKHDGPRKKKIHQCDVCAYQCLSKRQLGKHMETHKALSERQWFACAQCDYKTIEKINLKRHVISSEEPSYYNRDDGYHKNELWDGKILDVKKSPKKRSQNKRFVCDTCQYQTDSLTTIRNHIRSHKKLSEVKNYKCPICPKRSKYKASVKAHIQSIHRDPKLSKPKKFSCGNCDFTAKQLYGLRKHMITHSEFATEKKTKIDFYKCEVCDFKATRICLVKKHQNIHLPPSEVELYKCKLCPYTSKFKNGVFKHMTVHKKLSETTMYECEVCPYKSKWSHCLRNHLKTHKKRQKFQSSEESANFNRDEGYHKNSLWDGQILKAKRSLKTRSQNKKFLCNTCQYQTDFLHEIRKHIILNHKSLSEVKSYKCSLCPNPKRFKANRNLQQHIHFVHADPAARKKFSCGNCKFETNKKSTMKCHMITHSEFAPEKKPKIDFYKCEVCSYTATRKCAVQMHQNIHLSPSEMELYKCEFCPYTSKFKYGVANHMTVHKKLSETTMYECEVCPYKSKWSHCLRNHLKTHKKRQVPVHKCEHCNFKANNKYSVATHKKKAHKELFKKPKVEHRCDLCEFKCKTTGELTKHKVVHKKLSDSEMFTCDMCGVKIKTKSQSSEESANFNRDEGYHKNSLWDGQILKAKRSLKTRSQNKKFLCNTCQYQTDFLHEIRKHIILNHKSLSEVKSYKCSLCPNPKRFKANRNLQQHIHFVHADPAARKKFSCGNCKFETNKKSTMKCHMITHSEFAPEKKPRIDFYKCEVCSYTATRKRAVQMHQNIHLSPSEMELYKCEFCPYTSKFKYGVANHMTVHKKPSETTMYECEVCPYKSKWPHCLRNHLKTHKKQQVPVHKCEHCNFKANNKYSVATHKKMAHKELFKKPKVEHRCDLCEYKSKTTGELTRHKVVHKKLSDSEMLTCDMCGEKLKTKNLPSTTEHNNNEYGYRLNKRWKRDTSGEPPNKEKRLICCSCDYQHNLAGRMRKHLVVHSAEKSHKCSQCPMRTRHKWCLREHIKYMHSDPNAPKAYSCESCDFKTHRRETLRIHSITHIEFGSEKKPDKIDWYKCEICDFKAKKKFFVDRHVNIHRPPSERDVYKCELCPYTSKFKGGVFSHMTVHKKPSEATMYECEVCPYKSKWPHCLRNHLTTHKKVPVHKCEHCDFKTNNRYSVATHKKTVHKELYGKPKKEYKCDICNYIGKTSSCLDRHKIVHKTMSKDEMFTCAICGMQTKVKRSLRHHILKVHGFLEKNKHSTE
ncbi:unnamed protein product [Phaedon cochleariae]|uniref:C2H2-type domain-containing protein n=1 Tax=Phaedon cochleariae TaxID=80249 RepID=A0A9N9SKG8_PHACE|nr:unnamed protein product [Phaedon cochleariae]